MNIKVNVPILNKKANEVVNPDDPNYQHFRLWATNKDINGGSIICEFVEAEEETIADGSHEDTMPAMEEDVVDQEDSQTNDKTTGDSPTVLVDETVEDTHADTTEDVSTPKVVMPPTYECDFEGCEFVGKSERSLFMHKIGKRH